jgi:hypothetical protein
LFVKIARQGSGIHVTGDRRQQSGFRHGQYESGYFLDLSHQFRISLFPCSESDIHLLNTSGQIVRKIKYAIP